MVGMRRAGKTTLRLLSRDVHTSLRGRGMATVIRPFSFREFLVEGGFPEAQGLDAPAPRWQAVPCLMPRAHLGFM